MELTDIVAKINCIRDLKILGRVRDLTARFLLKYLENFYCIFARALYFSMRKSRTQARTGIKKCIAKKRRNKGNVLAEPILFVRANE